MSSRPAQGDLFADDAASAARPTVRRVSLVRLAGEIARSFAGIGRIAVQGEIVRAQRRPNGRVYFTLKDRAASLTVSVPGKVAAKSRLADGERVQVTGRLEWWTEWGRTQMVADEVVPVGAGAVAAWVEEVRARLVADGLVDRPRRPLPLLPSGVGVICGAEAAVRHDIISVVAERFSGYPVRFLETTVSGPGAAAAIVDALARLDADPAVEVIVLARGGGDATQLLAFSDEDVCRAVAGAATPVVSAIGHHEDRPLCDEVADLRCGTPSIAAAAVIPHRGELIDRLDRARHSVAGRHQAVAAAAAHRLERIDVSRALLAAHANATASLDRAGHRLAVVHPRRMMADARHRLDRIDWRSPADRRLERSRERLGRVGWQTPLASRTEAAAARLAVLDGRIQALSPAAVLARGYAVVRATNGSVIRDPAGLAAGDRLSVQVAGGSLSVTVDGVHLRRTSPGASTGGSLS